MKLYNTMTSSVEEFIPHDANNVTMYVCGPTVYDRAHIGNARPAVVFDLLFRVLKRKYSNVTYARNFTDIDDKIIDRANKQKNKKSIDDAINELTNKTIQWYHEDMAELNVQLPSVEPRATQYVAQMISMIQMLINKGHAYVSNNTVLFDVKSHANHGKLSNRTINEQIVGSKNEKADYKKSPEDFVLWKPSSETQPSWQSPWGNGRPGWHIECSAMIREIFGNHIDIHGGGIDLLFPHHENEISQSCASCDHDHSDFVKYWVHNNFVTVNNEKMSKSLGNFFTVNDLLKSGANGQSIRFVLMKTHYRQVLKWTDESIEEANAVLSKWHDLTENVDGVELTNEMIEPLFDDLNMPLLITQMHEYASNNQYNKLKTIMDFIGLTNTTKMVNSEKVEKLINFRNVAKSQKRYHLADGIRKTLVSDGIEIRDLKDKTEWKQRNFVTDARLDAIYEFYKNRTPF